jgi:hypothetical protein
VSKEVMQLAQWYDINKVAQAMYGAHCKRHSILPAQDWGDVDKECKDEWLASAKDAAKEFGAPLEQAEHERVAVERSIERIMEKVVKHETLVNLNRANQLMQSRADIKSALCEALAQPEQEHDINKVAQAMYEAFDKVWYEGRSKYDAVSPCVSWMVNSKEIKAAWIAVAKEAAKQFGVDQLSHDKKLFIVKNWFSEDDEIERAMGLLLDYEMASRIPRNHNKGDLNDKN